MRPVLTLAGALALILVAHADSEERFSLRDYPARVDEMKTACTAGPGGPECRVALMSVLPSTVEALSYLGYNGSYEKDAHVLSEFAGNQPAEIRAAAIYALARLGPKAEDLPVLRSALLSDRPGLRRAALGAMKLLPDPLAQELYARASTKPSYLPSGSYFDPDRLPFDPARAGLAAWPDQTRFLFFQRLWDRGTYVFTTASDVATTVAMFEAQAGTKAVGMGDVLARYGDEHINVLEPWKARNETLGAVQAILLKAPEKPSETEGALIALVYEDYALAATGFALVSLPGARLPGLPQPQSQSEAGPAAPDQAWYEDGKFIAKEGAAQDDVAAWRQVLDAEGDGAQAYLDAFPDGAYREEAGAIVNAPRIETDFDLYAETDSVNVHWRGIAPGEGMRLVLGLVAEENVRSNWAIAEAEVTTDEGDAQLLLQPYVDAGVYEVRIINAEDEAVASRTIRIALTSATLTLDTPIVKPGADVRVTFSGMPGSPRDVISIESAETARNTMGSLRAETGGKTEGSVTLRAPSQPGNYQVRAWFNGERRERGRVALIVKGPDVPPEPADSSTPSVTLAAATFEAGETILVRYAGLGGEKGSYLAIAPAGAPASKYYSYVDTKGPAGTAEMKLPAEPGDYEIRAFIGGRSDAAKAVAKVAVTVPAGVPMATLSLDKTSYAPGETIGVDYKSMSGSKQDYVAIAAPDARYSQYESYVYTKGAVDGHAELKAPTKPGSYEVRAFFDEQEDILRARIPFTVEGAP